MRNVDMAVVISEDAGEEDKFKALGLNIKPHRDRLNEVDKHGHDVEYNFKDPEHPLQLAFVCAMWLTGFDAPTVSTLYLDKPMKDHTLMQAIARANRVTPFQINNVTKRNGEIVDYYNVFRNMQKALKDYAQGEEGLDNPPVREKSELFKLLDDAVEQGLAFCNEHGIQLNDVLDEKEVFKKIQKFREFADILLERDDSRKAFYVYDNTITSLYEACKPEILSKEPRPVIFVFQYLRDVIDSIIEQQDIDEISLKIAELLDESVVVDDAEKFTVKERSVEYKIVQKGKVWDLSKIDFEKLRADFKDTKYKNIEITDLRSFIEKKIDQMLKQNITRTDFAQRLQQIIDNYNAGGSSTENYYEDLVKFTQDIKEEDERHVRENLTMDELEIYDLIKKDNMTKEEKNRVKLAAKALLSRIREKHPKLLIQDWYKDTQSQNQVKSEVEKILNENLPDSYDIVIFKSKCDSVYDTIYDYSYKGLKWAA